MATKDPGTNKSELAIIKSIGATPVKNSGRGMKKGDFTLGPFMGDVKEAEKSFTLNESVWAKVCNDALTHNDLDPMLLVVLGGQTKLAVVPWETLEVLLHERSD